MTEHEEGKVCCCLATDCLDVLVPGPRGEMGILVWLELWFIAGIDDVWFIAKRRKRNYNLYRVLALLSTHVKMMFVVLL